ncbi:hypothetical protein [Streptomyces monashensis]|uniref:Uncharacterized protein n=1 Tax=Streptomyces monashensis TaxID=1678012 RepID=A0A1S2QJU5_9ACTN|nr:hypothetical protein BIV23_08100 [Streptomyces monashensis]
MRTRRPRHGSRHVRCIARHFAAEDNIRAADADAPHEVEGIGTEARHHVRATAADTGADGTTAAATPPTGMAG